MLKKKSNILVHLHIFVSNTPYCIKGMQPVICSMWSPYVPFLLFMNNMVCKQSILLVAATNISFSFKITETDS